MWWSNHVGFGILFRIERKTNRILVESRLLKSPAAEAGLVRYEELLEYNGESFAGLTADEKKKRLEEIHVRKVGGKARMKFRRTPYNKPEEIFEVEMTAKRIWGTIPDYADYHWSTDTEDGMIQRGMFYCKRTGYLVPTARLSVKALEAVIGVPLRS